MNWLELHINTNHKGLDRVTALLSSLGIDSVVIDDETDFQEFLENNHQYWDYVDEDLEKQMAGKSRITFYLEDAPEAAETVTAVKIALASSISPWRSASVCWSSPNGRLPTPRVA